jgi:hypothetical protein
MSIIDDIADAVSSYPATNVTLDILDFEVKIGTSGDINVNETWAFQVRVYNNGHLNMTNVSLQVEGLNGVTVGTAAAGPFGPSVTAAALATVNAHSNRDTVNIFMKAPSGKKPAGTVILKAHISSFDLNWDHILVSHTGNANQPTKTITSQIYP